MTAAGIDPLTVEHGISCKKGGLVGQRDDNTRDEASELAAMALTKPRIPYEPTFFMVRALAQDIRARAKGRQATIRLRTRHAPTCRHMAFGKRARLASWISASKILMPSLIRARPRGRCWRRLRGRRRQVFRRVPGEATQLCPSVCLIFIEFELYSILFCLRSFVVYF